MEFKGTEHYIMIWKMECKGTEHYIMIWNVKKRNITKYYGSLHAVPRACIQLPKFIQGSQSSPWFQEVPLACMQFHNLAGSSMSLHAVLNELAARSISLHAVL